MRIAMLAPIAWRTPPRHYGPWETVVSLLTEGLVKRGIDVTLFATGDSETSARLHAVCNKGYEEDPTIDPKVWECLHISEVFEKAHEFDLIHNHFDFLPLTYSGLVKTPVISTIHGFSSPKILPVYRKYNGKVFYVSISNADRSPELDYIATVYHGIDLRSFTFNKEPGDYLLFFGRIHHDKGAKEAVEIAKKSQKKLIIAGIIQDRSYFKDQVEPFIDGRQIIYEGPAGPKRRDELMGRAIALLHPINFEEPFGLSVIESMACGTPVIAFNRGSMPEVINNGKTGFLVSSQEEAIYAIQRIGEIDREECRRWVQERFSADRMVEDYIEVYRKVLDLSRREDRRPWGYYQILEESKFHKVKRIVIYPGQRLSLQRHLRRAENWNFVQGEAIVRIGTKEFHLKRGQSIEIPLNCWHRISNPGKEDLVFIEIQTGDYFGEDDIERAEDDYGRV